MGGERGMGEFKIERIHILSSHFICQVTTFLRDNATCDNIRTISEYNATPDNLLALRHCCVIAKIVGSAQLWLPRYRMVVNRYKLLERQGKCYAAMSQGKTMEKLTMKYIFS